MGKRLIDANTACERCRMKSAGNCGFCIIGTAPTVDAVQVVRCKDCKHSSEDGGYDSIEQMKTHLNCRRIHRGFIGCVVVPKEGFCNYGERKGNG